VSSGDRCQGGPGLTTVEFIEGKASDAFVAVSSSQGPGLVFVSPPAIRLAGSGGDRYYERSRETQSRVTVT